MQTQKSDLSEEDKFDPHIGITKTGSNILSKAVCTVFQARSQKLRKATVSFVMSVRPSAWNNSAPTGRLFMKFDI